MTDKPATVEQREALQRDVDRLLQYVFNFYDPATIGDVLQHCGYTPSTEVATLVEIVRNENGAYGPYAVMGAIKMLQEVRHRALEYSGHLAEVTQQQRSDGSVEAMRTIKVTQNVAGHLRKETPDERLPGEHKLPRIGLLPAGGADVPVVSEGALQESAGAPDTPGEVPGPAGSSADGRGTDPSEGEGKPLSPG